MLMPGGRGVVVVGGVSICLGAKEWCRVGLLIDVRGSCWPSKSRCCRRGFPRVEAFCLECIYKDLLCQIHRVAFCCC